MPESMIGRTTMKILPAKIISGTNASKVSA